MFAQPPHTIPQLSALTGDGSPIAFAFMFKLHNLFFNLI